MPRYVAFLRALNVGGHVVKMDVLRSIFESRGFAKVETFIASGNVIFETPSDDTAALGGEIEADLHKALGYDVATFLRTDAEVAAISAYQPFPDAAYKSSGAFVVGFLDAPLTAASEAGLLKLKNEVDDFHVAGPELYWLCQTRQSESPFFKVSIEKLFKIRVTFRGMNTVRRLAAKYPPR